MRTRARETALLDCARREKKLAQAGLSDVGDPSELEQALVSLWAHASLDGSYLDRTREATEQPRLASGTQGRGFASDLLGIATPGEFEPIACSTRVVREDGGSDWLYFGLPWVLLDGSCA